MTFWSRLRNNYKRQIFKSALNVKRFGMQKKDLSSSIQFTFLQKYLNSARREARKDDGKDTEKKAEDEKKKNNDWLTE